MSIVHRSLEDHVELTSCLQFFYILLSCLALSVALLERHNPILTLPVADKLLLVSHELRLSRRPLTESVATHPR
jgi:hypothetical protein